MYKETLRFRFRKEVTRLPTGDRRKKYVSEVIDVEKEINLPLTEQEIKDIKYIISEQKKVAILSSLRSSTVLAGAIYLATKSNGKHITQRDISDVVGCTEISIRNTYKKLLRKIDTPRFKEIAKNFEKNNVRKRVY